ncbi:DUF732 domain-containing protein [Streptomyces bauhiniae]|uniref:DUF732 domain-containing protein n=1 Tax=Streptomyces bauhiniae TaxID=2340725 RepID=UPI0033B14E72
MRSTAPAAPADAAPTAEQTALLGKLRAIKPELVAKEDRALRRADSVCDDVRAGKDAATLAKNANFRYSGGTAGQLTNAQGAQIVDAVQATICK